MASFAYLFERFPSFTQTFCYREVAEMRSRLPFVVYSIRRPNNIPIDCEEDLRSSVHYFPEEGAIKVDRETRKKNGLTAKERKILKESVGRPDNARVYEALWLGPRLQKQGIRHVHAHFAGIAARTAYWLKMLYGITFSFTGHANDIFCETGFSIQLSDLIRHASFVVTETNFSRDWLQERYPDHAVKIHRVYNGIDLSLFPEEALAVATAVRNPATSTPHIVSIGRCVEKKGFSDLIDACAVLRERGIKFECSIVGDGPLEESLCAQVRQRGLQSMVRLTGSLPQAEVRALLSRSDLFVLACVTEANGGMDNFPTVIVEAMASALPVVSTRLAGVPEMVEHGTTGLLVAERDPSALADAMTALLGDPLLARQLGERGRRRVVERFAIDVSALDFKNLLLAYNRKMLSPENGIRLKKLFFAAVNAVSNLLLPTCVVELPPDKTDAGSAIG